MLKYIGKRVLYILLSLWLIVTATFFLCALRPAIRSPQRNGFLRKLKQI